MQVNTIRFHPANSNWVYVGTDLGVYASEDRGLTWKRTPRAGTHDGPANVEVDELFWQGSDYLIAATHGRGMYRVRPFVVVYVDRANTGSEDGTSAHPYNTVQEGIDTSGNGSTISIRAGDYPEGAKQFTKRGAVIATSGSVHIH